MEQRSFLGYGIAPVTVENGEHLLRVEGVSKVYGKRKVVDQVSLQVDRGEVVGLLGRNGAGKTTTFRMVIGIVRPNGGKIVFCGDVVTKMPIYKRSRKPRMKPWSSPTAIGSTPEKGSSSIRIEGLVIIARQISRRRISPPESV